ncbi:MAG TPA: hypothetical protein VF618_28350 [Thermoanaerobaculia bacterium]
MLRRPRRFWPLYSGWILLCAILFLLLSGAEDPSRRRGRILSNDAGRIALAILRERDRPRFRNYEVVHVAAARAGEGAPEARWVVLVDRVPHTGLREAYVVELEAETGKLLRIRRPGR